MKNALGDLLCVNDVYSSVRIHIHTIGGMRVGRKS
jgi:hypothetical protein